MKQNKWWLKNLLKPEDAWEEREELWEDQEELLEEDLESNVELDASGLREDWSEEELEFNVELDASEDSQDSTTLEELFTDIDVLLTGTELMDLKELSSMEDQDGLASSIRSKLTFTLAPEPFSPRNFPLLRITPKPSELTWTSSAPPISLWSVSAWACSKLEEHIAPLKVKGVGLMQSSHKT